MAMPKFWAAAIAADVTLADAKATTALVAAIVEVSIIISLAVLDAIAVTVDNIAADVVGVYVIAVVGIDVICAVAIVVEVIDCPLDLVHLFWAHTNLKASV